jgi:hypothetical protein
MRLANGSKAEVNTLPAWRDLKVRRRSAHLARSRLSLPRGWHASGRQGPLRRGRRAQACYPIGRNLPMRIATGQQRCPTYTPRVSIEDAPALTLLSSRLGYRLHRRRNGRRSDAR